MTFKVRKKNREVTLFYGEILESENRIVTWFTNKYWIDDFRRDVTEVIVTKKILFWESQVDILAIGA